LVYARIKEICNKRKMPISELEKRCGFGNATIDKWKTNVPRADNLALVADELNVSIDYLLGREEKKEDETGTGFLKTLESIDITLKKIEKLLEEKQYDTITNMLNGREIILKAKEKQKNIHF